MESVKVFQEIKTANRLQLSLSELRINKECQKSLGRFACLESFESLKVNI